MTRRTINAPVFVSVFLAMARSSPMRRTTFSVGDADETASIEFIE
jgi:hypothetical protein